MEDQKVPYICSWCKQPVALLKIFRCYDCGTVCHQDCLKAHCKESRMFDPAPTRRTLEDTLYWIDHLSEEEKESVLKHLTSPPTAPSTNM